MDIAPIITKLKTMGNPTDREGMARFGIDASHALGIRIPALRKYAKQIKKDNALAKELWKSKIHEARLLAVFITDPKGVDEKQMESWAKDFNSWDLCDQCCSNVFDKTPIAFEKAIEWTSRKEEFIKRAGFTMMATLAVHAKKASDDDFRQFFPYIIKEAGDERNFVKKAVNWALRQIGKRNNALRKDALKIAKQIQKQNSKSAKWIATDAIRELEGKGEKEKLKFHTNQ